MNFTPEPRPLTFGHAVAKLVDEAPGPFKAVLILDDDGENLNIGGILESTPVNLNSVAHSMVVWINEHLEDIMASVEYERERTARLFAAAPESEKKLILPPQLHERPSFIDAKSALLEPESSGFPDTQPGGAA